MSEEPENFTLALLRKILEREDGRLWREELTLGNRSTDVKSEVRSLRADVASDMMTLEKRLSDQIVGLRRAVMEYHSSAIAHGVLLTEFEERLRRLERHVGLPPEGEAH